MVEMAE